MPWTRSAAAAFYRWLGFCADSEVPELHRLARTLDSWREELLARFTVGAVSNGPTEAINLLIKKIKRVGHGFRNFANYRLLEAYRRFEAVGEAGPGSADAVR